jgi:hypothetical protein
LVAATVTVLVLTTVAVNAVGNSTEQLDRIGPLRPTDLARRARAITHALRTEHDERAMPSPASMALRPVYAYVQACTLPSDRLMYVGFGPEIYFYAHRGFAAGQATYLATYYSGADDQRRMRDRLARERTPVAIMPEDNTAWFARTFPLVNAELRARYRAVSTVDLGRGERGRLLVDGTLPVRGTYGEGGWPCFR